MHLYLLRDIFRVLFPFFSRCNQLEILSCLSVDLESPDLASESRLYLSNLLMSNSNLSATSSYVGKIQETVFESCQDLNRLGRGKSASQGLLYESQELDSKLTKLHGQLILLKEMEAAR